ncbi:hypothetical protein P4131_30230 [Pseudomonas aeruginosa]|nr:hypothetical protein [Pseudomonas aeruginosa]
MLHPHACLPAWPWRALLAAAYAAPPEARAGDARARRQASHLDVAAGPLDQVLLGISRQSGLLISFEQSLVRGRQAPAVRGPLVSTRPWNRPCAVAACSSAVPSAAR